MYDYAFPNAAGTRKPRSRETEHLPVFREMLDAIGDVIAEGLQYLYSVTPSPRPLTLEGEKLEEHMRRAPDNQPPRNLLQAVQSWLQRIKQWVKEHVPPFNRPTLTERVKVLEHKVDALAVDLQEFRRELNESRQEVKTQFDESRQEAQTQFDKSRQEVQEEFKSTRNNLHKHVNHVTSAMEIMAQEIYKRLDMIEDATAHDRARIIEEALRNWALSPQAWRDVIPPAWTDAWITTEDLWMDRAQPRYWPALCQDIGLPETSAVRTCDMLALVDIQDPRAPAPFLFVGEASVNMDSGRLHKVIRHAREIATHTAYQAVPCVCANAYSQSMLDMAESMGAMALQWQRGDAAKVVALPDRIRTFLGWTKG